MFDFYILYFSGVENEKSGEALLLITFYHDLYWTMV